MPSPCFIKSKLGDLVIDILDGKTKPGSLLDVFTRKTKSPNWNNQLWELVESSYAGYYLIQNPATKLVIDVFEASTTPGTPLDAYTLNEEPPARLTTPNQMWAFLPSSEAGFYFIKSHLGDLVIDVKGAAAQAGTHLDAYTQKTSSANWANQLWTFLDEKGNSVTPPAPPSPSPAPK